MKRLMAQVLLAGALLPLAATIPARSAVLIPVPSAPNSTVTTAFALNDSDVVAGSYIGASDGIEHAFYGTLDGNYTSFDAGSGGSEARGISNDGTITGLSNSQNGTSATEPIFERDPAGNVTNVTMSGAQLFGLAQGINGRDKFAGYYWNTQTSAVQGFVGRNDEWKADVKVPAENQFAGALGINDKSVTVGFFFAPPLQGFILDKRTLTVVNYPSSKATATILNGINDKGRVAGQWVDGSGNQHSFVYDQGSKKFTDIKVKGATVVRAWAINAAGAVAISTDIGSYVWCEKASQCPSPGVRGNLSSPGQR